MLELLPIVWKFLVQLMPFFVGYLMLRPRSKVESGVAIQSVIHEQALEVLDLLNQCLRVQKQSNLDGKDVKCSQKVYDLIGRLRVFGSPSIKKWIQTSLLNSSFVELPWITQTNIDELMFRIRGELKLLSLMDRVKHWMKLWLER